MSALTGSDWNAERIQAIEPARADVETVSLSAKLVALRDTLIVLGMQLVFRATMFLRHLNY